MNRWFALLAAAAIFLPASAFAVSSALSPEANAAFITANAHKPGVIVLPDGMQYRVLTRGFGERPKDGDTVTVYYALSLINGDRIQATEPDFPSQFPINSLISGWREALHLMRTGDHWQLFIPSSLGYGPRGTPDGSIPPNQTLVFDIELLKTVTPPAQPDKDDDQDSGH